MGITNAQKGAQFFKGGVIGPTVPYPADGAISPTFSHSAMITKSASAAVDTLAVPGRDGICLEIISNTAQAHGVTATGLINDGATGAPHTTLLFAAFPGASIVLRSYAGKWNVVSKNGVTVS